MGLFCETDTAHDFEKLSCDMKTMNLPKEKYDSEQELKLHLATSGTLTGRETVGNVTFRLHPDSLNDLRHITTLISSLSLT